MMVLQLPFKKIKNHYICVAAPAEVTAKDHQTEHCLPGVCRETQSFRVEFSIWRDDLLFIPTASPGNVHKSTNALCITQMMDTLIPWESLAMKWNFLLFLYLFFLLCLAFFCTFLWDHSMSLFFFLFFFSAPGTCFPGKEESTIWFFDLFFLVLREGFFTPPLLVSTTVAVWHCTTSLCASIMHTACPEAMEIRTSLWGLFSFFQPLWQRKWKLTVWSFLVSLWAARHQ